MGGVGLRRTLTTCCLADHVGGRFCPSGPVGVAFFSDRLGSRIHEVLDLDLRRPHFLFAGSGLRLSFNGDRYPPGDFTIMRDEAELEGVRVTSHGFDCNCGITHRAIAPCCSPSISERSGWGESDASLQAKARHSLPTDPTRTGSLFEQVDCT